MPITITNARFALLAAHHGYGLVFAVSSRNRHGLRGTAGAQCYRWKKRFGRAGKQTRRLSVRPIPRKILFVRVSKITRYRAHRLHDLCVGLAIRWPKEEPPGCGKESPSIAYVIAHDIACVVEMRRSSNRSMERRMRRSRNTTGPCLGDARLAECLAGRNTKRHAERYREDHTHFIRHDTPTNSQHTNAY